MSDVADSTARPPAWVRFPERHCRWWFWLIGVAGLLAMGYLSTRVFGWVSGEEFSPDTFQRRRFSYYEVPLLHLQITPIYREYTTNSLEQYLISQQMIQRATVSEPRWDLVWAGQGTQASHHGDAEILCAYLDAADSNRALLWKDWTEKNTDLAKILWPTIGRLAELQLYVLVPDVFSVAGQAKNARSLEQSLAELLADRYELLARTQTELGEYQSARQLAEEGLQHSPESEGLLRVLEDSKSSLAKRTNL